MINHRRKIVYGRLRIMCVPLRTFRSRKGDQTLPCRYPQSLGTNNIRVRIHASGEARMQNKGARRTNARTVDSNDKLCANGGRRIRSLVACQTRVWVLAWKMSRMGRGAFQRGGTSASFFLVPILIHSTSHRGDGGQPRRAERQRPWDGA
jgi:hypothetical protein